MEWLKKKNNNISHYFLFLIFTVVGCSSCKERFTRLNESGPAKHYGKNFSWFLLTKMLGLKIENRILMFFVLGNWFKLYMLYLLIHLCFHYLHCSTVNLLFLLNNGKMFFFIGALKTSFRWSNLILNILMLQIVEKFHSFTTSKIRKSEWIWFLHFEGSMVAA